ncbi:MAG: SDR family oxidoreductase [Chloroflexi bacterium]|nr:SDR family oxidoreductase [Chloroflexota bacterium]
MLALVTGSTGFLGSHLCRALLNAGYQVRALHRPTSSLTLLNGLPVEYAVGDITQPGTLTTSMRGVDAVFHAASKVSYWRDSNLMYDVTVGGTRNVLQAAMAAGVQRVVYTSSVAALGVPEQPAWMVHLSKGTGAPPLLINETHVWNYRPQWWRYGHAKHLAEREVQRVVARGLDVVIVNPATILGPGDVNRISGEIVIQVAKGIIPMAIPGGMNVIHVADAARGHLLALERGRTGERHILGGENITYLNLIQTTAEVTGVHAPKRMLPAWLVHALASPVDILGSITPLPINGDLLRLAGLYFYYDTLKAERILGFTRAYSARDMVQDTYEWYRKTGMI